VIAMVSFTVWIIEDESDSRDAIRNHITRVLECLPDVSCSFFFSDDGDGSFTHDSPGEQIKDEDLIETNCDCIVLDMNLAHSSHGKDLSGGISVLKRLSGIPNGCRNILITTGHQDVVRSEYWSEFNALLEGPLRDRVGFWPKLWMEQMSHHVLAIARARLAGVRHSARQVSYIRSLATSDDSVLILGESGVGKEQVARSIHESWCSLHPDENQVRPNFVTLNCAGLTTSLIRGELFGIVKGAFTGAQSHTLGRILEAAGIATRSAQSKNEIEKRIGELKRISSDLENFDGNIRPVRDAINRNGKLSDELGVHVDALTERAKSLLSFAKELVESSESGLCFFKDTSRIDSGTESFFHWIRSRNSNDVDWKNGERDVYIKPYGSGQLRARGTLFLDEFSTMEVESQRILLRFLNDWEIMPVGCEGMIRPLHDQMPLVRVIATSNSPEWMEMSKGRFDERPDAADVFFRLSRHVLTVPAPNEAEVDSLVEMERQRLGFTELRWDSEAIDEIKCWLVNKKIRGNRRQVRSIANRAMAYVRGAEHGIPVADPSVVSKFDLINACPMFADDSIEIAPVSPHIEMKPRRPESRNEDSLIDFDGGPNDFTRLHISICGVFDDLKRFRTPKRWDEWVDCSPFLFSQNVVNRFNSPEEKLTWKYALMRALLEYQDTTNVFEDPKRNSWHRLESLLVKDVVDWLKQNKNPKRSPTLEYVSKELRKFREAAKPTDSIEIKIKTVADAVFPDV